MWYKYKLENFDLFISALFHNDCELLISVLMSVSFYENSQLWPVLYLVVLNIGSFTLCVSPVLKLYIYIMYVRKYLHGHAIEGCV